MADVWEEHKTRLRGYIAKRVRAREDVDDIPQDVFVKVHTNAPTVKTVGADPRMSHRVDALSQAHRAQDRK